MIRTRINRNSTSKPVAVCDLGTFSGLILVAHRSGSRLIPIIEEKHTIDLLAGQGRTKRLGRTALNRAIELVRRFQTLARQSDAGRAAVVCTAAVREAPNGERFAESLRESTTYPVRVLSARQEAGLSALGALTGLASSACPSVVVDVGGGSTEVIIQANGRIDMRLIGCGAARATAEWAGDLKRPSRLRGELLSQNAAAVMNDLPAGGGRSSRVIGVGGTIVALAAIHARLRKFDADRLHGRTLTTVWVLRMANRLAAMEPQAIARLIPFDTGRARVLTAGTFLWAGVLNRLGADRVVVSVRGLRWGVATRLSERGRL